jgi:two-component system response regulator YesN
MYQVMLVDDEPVEIEALALLIQKNFPELNVCSQCSNALDAISQAKICNPDIIVMDINMPGPNGLQAIEEIRKTNPNCHFIVMTAHSKFEYAHQSIQLGVDDFVLKPARRAEITRVIEQIMDKINRDRRQKSESEKVLEVLEEFKPVLVQDIFRAIVFGNSRPELIKSNLRLLGIHTSQAFCAVIRLHIHNEYPDLEQSKNKFLTDLSFHANMISRCIVSDYLANDIVMLIPVDENAPVITESMKWRLNLVQHICSKSRQEFAELTIGIGTSRSIEQLNSSYREALSSIHTTLREKEMDSKFPLRNSFGQDSNDLFEPSMQQYPTILEKRLIERVVLTDRIKAAEYGQKLFNQIVQSCLSNNGQLTEEFANSNSNVYASLKGRICLLMQTLIREVVDQVDIHIELNQCQDMACDQINKAVDYRHLKASFLQAINSLIDQLMRFTPASNFLEKRAIDYINEHYHQNLSLSDVAEALKISSYYLSRVFHQKIGVTFTDYLTNLRIEKAKEMLVKDMTSIKEISLSTGFNSQIYFSKVFRKATGMTPNDFRQQFMH